eukprot:918650-Rhodomonas_salina.3
MPRFRIREHGAHTSTKPKPRITALVMVQVGHEREDFADKTSLATVSLPAACCKTERRGEEKLASLAHTHLACTILPCRTASIAIEMQTFMALRRVSTAIDVPRCRSSIVMRCPR